MHIYEIQGYGTDGRIFREAKKTDIENRLMDMARGWEEREGRMYRE